MLVRVRERKKAIPTRVSHVLTSCTISLSAICSFFFVPTRDTGHSWQEAQIGFKAELSRLKNEPSNPEQMEFFVLFFCSLFPLLPCPTPFLFCLPLLLCCKASWGPRGRGHASQCRLAALWGKVIPWGLGEVFFFFFFLFSQKRIFDLVHGRPVAKFSHYVLWSIGKSTKIEDKQSSWQEDTYARFP